MWMELSTVFSSYFSCANCDQIFHTEPQSYIRDDDQDASGKVRIDGVQKSKAFNASFKIFSFNE